MINYRNKSVIHITFDFPDSINNRKPKAVANLIQAQKTFQNIVFSLNRTSNPFADFKYRKEQNNYSINIFGLPFGIGLRLWMHFAFKKINKIILKEKIKFNLIHGHKLTFEGLIAKQLSHKFSVPYIITVRGHTDFTAIRFSPINKNYFLEILKKASKTIYLAPWSKDEIQRVYNGFINQQNSVILPNIIELDNSNIITEERFQDKFVTVFNLDSYKIKNIKRTILAMNIVHKQYPDLKLEIIGGGRSSIKIQKYIDLCTFPSNFVLLGAMEHKQVLTEYNKYLGFLLPSFPETFGLVFIEALNSGIPILYSRKSGIDGYFDDWQIGEKVKYNSVNDITHAIIKIYNENKTYRKTIQDLKESNGLQKFTENYITNEYLRILQKVAN